MEAPTAPPVPVDADWITSAEHLDHWLQAVPDGGVLGADTEFMRRDTFFPQLALLQLGHGDLHALVDPLAFAVGDTLERHVGRRNITCVMHSAGEDLEVLSPLLPEGPSVLFDTQLAAAFCGLGLGLSYRALVARYCGVELDKGETRSDWMRRPLTDSQRLYATLDVVYLDTLHDRLSRRLHERGRTDWFAEDCQRLKRRADPSATDAQPQRDMRGAADWSRERQVRLRRVLLWRERAARELDKPRPWLLDDGQAMSLAQQPPTDGDDLYQRTRGQRALRSEQRHELLALLRTRVEQAEIDATAPIPPHPQGEAKRALAAMKQAINARADELDLPPGLLCPRKALEEYVVTRQWPTSVEGWRRSLLQPDLEPLLPG